MVEVLNEKVKQLLFVWDDVLGGKPWKWCVFFDADASDKNSELEPITEAKLLQRMGELVALDEQIVKALKFTTPMKGRCYNFHRIGIEHEFVLFQTKGGWWWSLEKHKLGIFVQRSRNINAVMANFKRKPRNKHYLLKDSECSCSIKDVIEWFISDKELYKKYNVFTKNCQHFASDAYHFLVRTEYHKIQYLEEVKSKKLSCNEFTSI